MTGRTHAAAGALVGALAGRLAGEPVAGMVVGALAALLPDVDHPGSLVGRRVRPVSALLETLAGHRTITHTVWFCLAGSVLAALGAAFARLARPLWWTVGACALLGLLSHLFLDALTRTGVEPFVPLKALPPWLDRLRHPRGPVVTGDPVVEVPVFIALTWAALRVAGVY
ncbi:MAG: metal-dependent hydrolase [Bacillota bacterium]